MLKKENSTLQGRVNVLKVSCIEKNLDNSIFLTTRTKQKSAVFEIPLEINGDSEAVRYVVVGTQEWKKNFDPADVDTSKGIGILTTSHLKAIIVLLAIWESEGRPADGKIDFRIYDVLTKYYNFSYKDRGEDLYESFRKILRDLASIPIWFVDCYVSTDGTDTHTLDEFNMKVLSELHMSRRKQHGKVKYETVRCGLDAKTLKNIFAGLSRPLLLEPLIRTRENKPKSDIGVLLYKFSSSVVSDVDQFAINSASLFKELGLKAKSYQNRSNRKDALKQGIEQNQGDPVIDGVLHLELVEGKKRNEDHKLLIEKKPFAEENIESSQKNNRNVGQSLIQEEDNSTKALDREGKELVSLLLQHGFRPKKSAIKLVSEPLEWQIDEQKEFGKEPSIRERYDCIRNQIEYLEFLIKQGDIPKNKGGFLRKGSHDNYLPPETFKSSEDKRAIEKKEKKKKTKQNEAAVATYRARCEFWIEWKQGTPSDRIKTDLVRWRDLIFPVKNNMRKPGDDEIKAQERVLIKQLPTLEEKFKELFPQLFSEHQEERIEEAKRYKWVKGDLEMFNRLCPDLAELLTDYPTISNPS